MPFGIGKSSKTTNHWLIRQDDPNHFKIIDKSTDFMKFRVSTRTAATRSYYYVNEGDKVIAEIEQDQIENTYHLMVSGEKIGTLKISERELTLDIGKEYRSKPEIRAKGFDFVDDKGNLVFTIDKLKLSLNDKYAIEAMKSMDQMVVILVAVCIDDFYHKGLTS